MIQKTRGIVFRFTRFKENSIIVSILTEILGLQSFIVNGVQATNKSKSSKIALFQPLTLLDAVIYYRDSARIHRIKEVRCAHAYVTLSTEIKKSTLAIFINEILNKTIREEDPAIELFEFLWDSLLTLDQMQRGFENFHLIFLIKLSRFLGFGIYEAKDLNNHNFLDPTLAGLLQQLVTVDHSTLVTMTNTQRRIILNTLIQFYREHVENLGEVKSIAVLRDVLT